MSEKSSNRDAGSRLHTTAYTTKLDSYFFQCYTLFPSVCSQARVLFKEGTMDWLGTSVPHTCSV